MPTWTPLGQRQLCTFYDPLNLSNSFTPQFNYQSQDFTPGNVRKYSQTINGTNIISGDREYPPTEIDIVWPQIDIADYNKLKVFTAITPCVFVDNNDNGFLGVLVIDKAGQIPGKTSNVWAVSAKFLVLSPYNGLHTNINAVTPPTLSVFNQSNGFIGPNVTMNFWATAFTAWGESQVSPVASITTPNDGLNNHSIAIQWVFPSSIYLKKVRLYWNSASMASNSTMLADIQAGFNPSFFVYGPFVNYNTINPPLFGTAFSGYWAGGQWVQA